MSGLLKIITPINLETEKEKFFSSKTYHPIFRYRWDHRSIKAYLKKTPEKGPLVTSILIQDHRQITESAQGLFQTKINPVTLSTAKRFTKPDHLRLRHPDITRVVNAFKRALKYFNLDYQIIVSPQEGFNVRPKQSRNMILISKSLSMHFFSIDGLIKHEMSHVIRYENEKFNKLNRSSNYLPTEEGLSTYVQDYGGRWGKISRYQHAAEYVATSIGVKGSLRDIYDYLRSLGFPKELAWQRASRHKFGFIDTSKPGDIIKPAMYFHYCRKIRRLSPKQRLKLYVGKVSLDDLKNIKAYYGKFPEKQIKDFFNL